MNRPVGRIRGRRNDIENHVHDEFLAGRIDRREFFRRGAVVGMSVPLLSTIVAACGGSSRPSPRGGGGPHNRRGGGGAGGGPPPAVQQPGSRGRTLAVPRAPTLP